MIWLHSCPLHRRIRQHLSVRRCWMRFEPRILPVVFVVLPLPVDSGTNSVSLSAQSDSPDSPFTSRNPVGFQAGLDSQFSLDLRTWFVIRLKMSLEDLRLLLGESWTSRGLLRPTALVVHQCCIHEGGRLGST